MLFHIITSLLIASPSSRTSSFTNRLGASSEDLFLSQTIELPKLEIPIPKSFSAQWSRELKIWYRNGDWFFSPPNSRLATDCYFILSLGVEDQRQLFRNRYFLKSFSFPGGKIKLIPQMMTGELTGNSLHFWTQEFGFGSIAPDHLESVQFLPYLIQSDGEPLQKGIPLLTETAQSYSKAQGTQLTSIRCQGPRIRMEGLQKLFLDGSQWTISSND